MAVGTERVGELAAEPDILVGECLVALQGSVSLARSEALVVTRLSKSAGSELQGCRVLGTIPVARERRRQAGVKSQGVEARWDNVIQCG
jgi:hypothetical protein